jgi:epoxyqueuosine reductase
LNLTSSYIKKLITDKAKELGFVHTGFSKAEVIENESARLRTWLDKGYAADMNWIEKGFEKRKDVKLIVEDAKSVISLAYNYYTPFEHDDTLPKISRYAWGKDYHKVLKKKLKELCEFIECHCDPECSGGAIPKIDEEIASREFIPHLDAGLAMKIYVDDGPVMDKAWAVKSGIGWMGKHTNVISPQYGSWIFLCNIITNIEFDEYDSPIEDLCGSCTLCISACPTGAIIDEYKVDANRCISYQTIENRGEIPENINFDGWIFGCDVCQDVCPYNSPKYNLPTDDLNFYPKDELMTTPPLQGGVPAGGGGQEAEFKSKEELSQITEEEFNIIFADSPIKRTKYKGWKRNLGKIEGIASPSKKDSGKQARNDKIN